MDTNYYNKQTVDGNIDKIDNSKFQNVNLNTIVGEVNKVKVYAIYGDTNNNCPAQRNGYLEVYNSNTRTRITQIYNCNELPAIWIRISDNNGATWTAWQKIATETDLAIKYGSIEWLIETESIYEQWVRQYGHNVDVHFGIKLKNALSTSPTEIAKIKDVSIPNPMIRSIANIGINAWDCAENCYMAVNTSGIITVTLATTSSKRCINVNIHYIV